ncbi:Bcl-2-like protein 1 [Bulinus truncatus]|nr:Bcl-2-like protein 1 [Bulinus truncatus]
MVHKTDDERIINDLSKIMEQGNVNQETIRIILDYIKYRLQNNGFTWENDGAQNNVSPNPIQNAMRTLGDEFEERFRSRFDDLVNQLVITDENAHETFLAIVTEIFSDGINWGRIVAMFGFSGRFAVRCFELNKPHIVDNLIEWVRTYVNANLSTWMNNHNNWQGFLDFQSSRGDNKADSPWPSFRTIVSCAAAGLGVLTLGAILSQKS